MTRPYGTYNRTDDRPPPDPAYDCEGDGGDDCGCKACKEYRLMACPCGGQFGKVLIGDECWLKCPDCKRIENLDFNVETT